MDVIDLREFYASGLGQIVRRTVARTIGELWPDARGLSMAGLGYATPFLERFDGQAERRLALMPARQGVTCWPPGGPSAAALVDDTDLPLPDASMDRLLLVHCLECTENSTALLREVWRVLAPGGRIMIVVPNRRGLWARFEHTPFGHGLPYSRSQLNGLLRDSMFTPQTCREVLWMPPFRSRTLIRSAGAFERAGQILSAVPPGVLVMDATKELYQALPKRSEAARRLRPGLVAKGTPALQHGCPPDAGRAQM